MTFLYAPAIGHYVRMESASTDGEAPLVRRLVSFSRDTGTAVADAAKTDRTKSGWPADRLPSRPRSEEHTSELQSLMRISYAVFCLQKKKKPQHKTYNSQSINTTIHTYKS